MKAPNLEETAKQIFGADDPAAVAHWVNYWNRGYERNLELLQSFEEVLLLDLAKQRVLDEGCGVGSMGEVLRERCSHYVGVDLNPHVLRFATPAARRSYVQASGISLPFEERSFDCIFAFDVLEHLPGGLPDQVRFLTELRRVLKPMGTILFTTPNFWHPYDAHSRSYFAHYLPVRRRGAFYPFPQPRQSPLSRERTLRFRSESLIGLSPRVCGSGSRRLPVGQQHGVDALIHGVDLGAQFQANAVHHLLHP